MMTFLHRCVLACVLASSLLAVSFANPTESKPHDFVNLVAAKTNVSATATIFDRLCYSHPASVPSCSVGPFVPLAKRAPEPVSVGGKLAAKTAAYMYMCYKRKTTDCEKDATCAWVDAEGYCTLSSTYLQTIRTTTVCPGSKAEVAAFCQARNKDESTCTSGSENRCKWVACDGANCARSPSNSIGNATLQCLGNINALLANDVSIGPGLESGDNSVWGCCDSQKLYLSMKKCKDIYSSTPCTGNCQWNDMRNECEASLAGQYAIWGSKEANFSTYMASADAICNGLATDAKCVAQYKVDIDEAKVTKYLTMELKELENACAEVLVSDQNQGGGDLMNTSMGGNQNIKFSGAQSMRPLAMLGLLPFLLLLVALF